jgi:hypothetical protein
MTNLADDFPEIRARRDELARARSQEPQCSDPKGCEHPGLDGPGTDLLLHALFGDDPDKVFAHAEALGPLDIRVDVMFVRCPGIELVRQPDGRWRGSVDGNPIGPYDKLPTALDVACSLREKFSR